MSKYYSETILSFSILIDGKRKRVVFSPLTNGGSTYITKNKEEIAALEKLDSFGKIFVKQIELEAEEKIEVKLNPVEDIKNYQEAMDYLISNHGLKKTALKTPDKILDAATKVGVSFPNITIE